MEKPHEKKRTNSPIHHDVFVPLTSLFVYGDTFQQATGEDVTVRNRYSIPNTGIELMVLSSRNSVEEMSDFELSEDLKIGANNFRLKKMMPRADRHSFNSGLYLKYVQPDPDSFMVMPHKFEDAVSSVITFLRLYIPGDLFAPYAFIDGKDIVHMHNFSCEDPSAGHSSIYYRNVEKFLKFYEKYERLAVSLVQKKNINPLFEGWFKRMNNCIYFYNQIYFADKRNQMNQGYADGNPLRLIYLCTALDALIGDGSASGKNLAKTAHKVLGKVKPNTAKDIEELYCDRSNYIHANPSKLKSLISDKSIKDFAVYIQKLLLVSLELASRDEYLEILKTKSAKHWFKGISDPGSDKLMREALKSIFSFEDGYELIDEEVRKARMNHWELGLIP